MIENLIEMMYRLEVVYSPAVKSGVWDIHFEPYRLGSGGLVRWVRVMNGQRSTRIMWMSYRCDRQGD